MLWTHAYTFRTVRDRAARFKMPHDQSHAGFRWLAGWALGRPPRYLGVKGRVAAAGIICDAASRDVATDAMQDK